MLAQDTEQARSNMIVQQIKPWDVSDHKVLDTMQSLLREEFVPTAYTGLAYADIEIPLGSGQSMLFPKVEARLLQALDIQPGDRILEIGTGSGYLTACLAKIGNFVISYDIHAALSDIARDNIATLGLGNVRLETGDIFATSLPAASFDVIAVTGSLANHSAQLEQLLAPNGRMFAVIGKHPAMEATLYAKDAAGNITRTGLFETSVAALTAPAVPEKFNF